MKKILIILIVAINCGVQSQGIDVSGGALFYNNDKINMEGNPFGIDTNIDFPLGRSNINFVVGAGFLDGDIETREGATNIFKASYISYMFRGGFMFLPYNDYISFSILVGGGIVNIDYHNRFLTDFETEMMTFETKIYIGQIVTVGAGSDDIGNVLFKVGIRFSLGKKSMPSRKETKIRFKAGAPYRGSSGKWE